MRLPGSSLLAILQGVDDRLLAIQDGLERFLPVSANCLPSGRASGVNRSTCWNGSDGRGGEHRSRGHHRAGNWASHRATESDSHATDTYGHGRGGIRASYQDDSKSGNQGEAFHRTSPFS
jgi:hypothetical protein